MLYIEVKPQENGAHASLFVSAPIAAPDGYALVSKELETKALALLPWVKLTVTGDVVTAIEDDVEARKNAPKPAQQVDPITQVQLAVAELAEAAAQNNLKNKLAIAELAEIVAGGK